MQLVSDRVRVQVPATSGNLGPGFDALGLALGIYDEVEVAVVPGGQTDIVVAGEGAGNVATDESHLVLRALRRALKEVGAPSTVGVAMTCRNAIPHGRGLGSSAAAVVAGLAAGRALLVEPEALSDADLLVLATEFEGHPDNAAPAIYGGATCAWLADDGQARAVGLDVGPELAATVLVPDFQLATKAARAALPAQVPHRDAAFNAGRAALLVRALDGRADLLFDATADRLHQEYRSGAMPPSWELLSRLRKAGFATVISGAGPAVLVLGDAVQQRELADALPRLLPDDAWRAVKTEIDRTGVQAELLT